MQRLTPVTMMDKATEKGLDRVAKAVLAPHFHLENNPARKVRQDVLLQTHSTVGDCQWAKSTLVNSVAKPIRA